MDDELIDDVFEDPKNFFQNTDTGLNVNESAFLEDQTPSPTGCHPAFRNVNLKSVSGVSELDDGWNSFKIADDNSEFDESMLHKVLNAVECEYISQNIRFMHIKQKARRQAA